MMSKEKWLELPPHTGHILSRSGYRRGCFRCIALFGEPPKRPVGRPKSIYQAWYPGMEALSPVKHVSEKKE